MLVHKQAAGKFQHTAARRRLAAVFPAECLFRAVSTHSRPKAAGVQMVRFTPETAVSTHSRPKAAGFPQLPIHRDGYSFNTQPPEGGWVGIILRF